MNTSMFSDIMYKNIVSFQILFLYTDIPFLWIYFHVLGFGHV